MATATLEIDEATLKALQAIATAQGLGIDALLRKFTESASQALSQPAQPPAETSQPTPYELAKDLIGSIDSSIPDPDSAAQPRDTAFGRYLLARHKQQVEKLNGHN